jgi:hypothetical protein
MKYNINGFYELDTYEKYCIIRLGMRMNNIISKYAITEDEIVSISKDVAEYVTYTRITDLKGLLFDENNNPILKIKRR